MKKIIKKYGSGFIMRITPDEMKIQGWKVGDILDLSDVVKIKGGKR